MIPNAMWLFGNTSLWVFKKHARVQQPHVPDHTRHAIHTHASPSLSNLWTRKKTKTGLLFKRNYVIWNLEVTPSLKRQKAEVMQRYPSQRWCIWRGTDRSWDCNTAHSMLSTRPYSLPWQRAWPFLGLSFLSCMKMLRHRKTQFQRTEAPPFLGTLATQVSASEFFSPMLDWN